MTTSESVYRSPTMSEIVNDEQGKYSKVPGLSLVNGRGKYSLSLANNLIPWVIN